MPLIYSYWKTQLENIFGGLAMTMNSCLEQLVGLWNWLKDIRRSLLFLLILVLRKVKFWLWIKMMVFSGIGMMFWKQSALISAFYRHYFYAVKMQFLHYHWQESILRDFHLHLLCRYLIIYLDKENFIFCADLTY